MSKYEEIKFNYFTRIIKGGDKCEVVSLDELKPGPTNEKCATTPCIQTYNCGFRRDGSHGDYSMWNGTIFTDIDSRKFTKSFNYKAFRQSIESCLEIHYPQNYCCNQTSGSGNSLHIILYYECERNETNFNKCLILNEKIIKDVAKKCGAQFEEIISYPNVYDSCTSHVGQPLYISAHEIHLSRYLDLLTGECDLENIELVENEYTEQEVKFNSDAKYKLKTTFGELPDYEYHTRWRLLWIILNYFNWDYDKCREVWSKIIPLILVNRSDYTEDKLWQQFERDFKTNRNKQYAFNSSMLEWTKKNLGFKYDIKRKFEPKDIDLYRPDIEYNLNSDQYISSINIKFVTGFNHMFARCGTGKTHFGIELGKKHKVLFITPLTSININSFGNVNEKWLILDANHKDEIIHIYGSVENALRGQYSICTTWESFTLYELYKYHWEYVIVDESHTMYMYDYRVKSIQALKQALRKLMTIPVILMSGTPSYEIMEFDCYKIKINKELPHIPCDILFYNETYKGYINNDIREWIKADENNLAVVFYDKTNYRTEEDFKYYGLEADIFNKNYKDNTKYVLKNENFKSQLTAVSVYGQAGINIYIDTDKKIRLYILNNNALGIIQYANRIRNKEVIDKVIIPYRIDRIDNNIRAVDEKANFKEAYTKISMINEVRVENKSDIFSMLANKSIIQLRFGLHRDVLKVVDDNIQLNESVYETWKIITNICEYESQIQLIYNRLRENYFDVNYIYLDEDVKHNNRTKMRSTQFAGQMVKFDFDKMVKTTKNKEKLYLEMTKNFEKIAVGDTKEVIEYILNKFWDESKDIAYVKINFMGLIGKIINEKGTIKKVDLVRYKDYLHICKHFHEYVDNAFLIGLLNPEMTVDRATAAYVRFIWSDKIDWKLAANETYEQMSKIKKIVSEYHESFAEMKDVNKLQIDNDDKMQMIYEYVIGKHNGCKNKGVYVNGVRYESQRDAAKKLNKSLGWISKNKDKN